MSKAKEFLNLFEKSEIPYWEPEWTKIEGQDVLQIKGSEFFAIPADGKKSAKKFVISNKAREEVAHLDKKEVRQWLIDAARRDGVKPTATL